MMTWTGWRRRVLTGITVGVAGLCAGSGAAHAQAPTPPGLVLLTNQAAFGPGTALAVTLGLQHSGAPVTVDLYFGVILPDGDEVMAFEGLGLAARPGRLSALASLRPLLPSLTIASGTHLVVPDFFRYTWQGTEPQGLYRLFFAATRPGALGDGRLDSGDLLAYESVGLLHLPAATLTTDPGHAGSAVVGAAGGTVTTTAADGTLYTLTVPAGALLTATPITLTPLTALGGWPVPVTLVAGVQGAPSGLTFARPATLAIELPGPLAGDVLGLPLPDSGAGFDLVPVARHGSRLQVSVAHFSVVAIPRSTPALLALLAGTGPFAHVTHLAQIAARSNQPADVQAVLDAMTAWYDGAIDPALLMAVNPAATDAERLAWLAAFYGWDERRAAIETVFGTVLLGGTPVRGRLTTRATAGRQGAVAVLGEGYAQWNGQCTNAAGPLADRLRLGAQAARYAVLVEDYLDWLQTNQADAVEVDQAAAPNREAVGVGRAQIPVSYCLTEHLEVAEPALSPGQTGDLRVTAGVVFGAPPALHGAVMEVGFQPDPATWTGYQVAATTDAGEALFPVTADGDGHLRYRVCAMFRGEFAPAGWVTALYRPEGDACRSSVDAVIVTPAQVSLAPGASQQFTVVVEGTSNQTVSWAVDGGGTITGGGLFTSDGTHGTYFVRATSAEDPNAIGVAQVTVGFPCVDAACTYTGTWTRCELHYNGQWICIDMTAAFSSPEVRITPRPHLDAAITVLHRCVNSGTSTAMGGTVQPHPAGAFPFTASAYAGTNVCILGEMTGTVTASSLNFTLPDGFNPTGRVYSFSGTR